ncbi:MAG: PilZ domain-containing protein [Acidobacteriota bacterium]
MGPHDQAFETQTDFGAVLDDPSLSGDRLLRAILAIGARSRIDPFRACLRALTRLDRAEPEARATLVAIDRHRHLLRSALGRDPGLGVAAADYLHSIQGLLGDPVFHAAGQAPGPEPDAPDPSSRGTIDGLLEAEIARAERTGRPVGLLLLAPDRSLPGAVSSLLAAAETLRGAARDTDHTGPLGTEGLAALLPCCGADEALRAAERLRAALSGATGGAWSSGAAAWPVHSRDPASLMECARLALAAARAEGGDRGRAYRPERRSRPRRKVAGALLGTLRRGASAVEVSIEDLSASGARVRLAAPLEPGSDCVLVVREPSARPREASMRTRVVRLEGAGEGGAGGAFSAGLSFVGGESERFRLGALLADLPPPPAARREAQP